MELREKINELTKKGKAFLVGLDERGYNSVTMTIREIPVDELKSFC
jgi:hypothetical protein